MGLPRFLVDRLGEQGTLRLCESESHHASRVLRLGSGDRCVVFDGQGHEADGTIQSVEKKSVEVSYRSCTFAPRDHGDRLHFAIGMPKGDRQRSVIEKLVELGVDRLTPIDTERSVSKFDADAIEKLKRYAIEACKQSQRNRLMHIDPSIGWKEWLARSVQGEPSSLWMLHPLTLHEAGVSGVRFVRSDRWLAEDPLGAESRVGSKSRVVFAVGPEGGFTAGEVAQAIEHGVGLLDLGERILRVETAVSAAAVLGSLRIGLSISVPDSPQRREVRQV